MTFDNILVSDNVDVANLFAQYFGSVYNIDHCDKISNYLTHSTSLCLSNIELIIIEVFERSILKPSIILGPDSILVCI